MRLLFRRTCGAGIWLAATLALVQLQAKPIRLRVPIFPPDSPPGKAALSSPANSRISGLYLIQFRDALQPQWREQLRTEGIDLLQYVPEDTYVARFHNVPLAQLRALPDVEWIGEFGPSHKLDRALQPGAPARQAARPLNVSILLAPRSSPAEIAAARQPFVSVLQQSSMRFGTILRGRISPAQLDALSRSDVVLWIEPAPDLKLFDEISSGIVAGEGAPHELYTQSLGYDGRGVAVAVADTGLDNGDAATMHPDLYGRTPAFFYYGTLADAADEHSHGTHVAGIIAGNGATGEMDEYGYLYGLGVAPGASIIAQRIFDAAGYEQLPPSFETMTRDATRAGAVIGSNSWGDDAQGRYNMYAMEFDALVRDADDLTLGDQPYIIEFSAGNAGPAYQTIGSPASAKNVVSSGASENNRPDLFIYTDGQEAMADFSSRGPCEDGRIKPDVVAPGTWIASLKSASAGDENAWAPIDDNYLYMGGTSQSGPHVSGAAAVFVQYYRETVTNSTPSPALVKAALINSAVGMDEAYGTGPVPNMDEGWGRIDLTELIGSQRRYNFMDQTVLLETGQVYERPLVVAGSDEPLKITLTYTDVPGFAGAIPALVNDLDLEVVGPDGTIYRGNEFSGGESIPNAAGADRINNVEGVYLADPLPGQYLIRVRGHNVAEDARVDTAAVDQDFALVSSGDLAAPGQGVVALDRKAYRAPGVIHIQVADNDQAGQASVPVTLRSDTESAGENVTLTAAGVSGVFTGAVVTATGPATTDGVLQIAHGDTIEANYFDASAGVSRTASARADFVPPVLTGVGATNSFGQATISWSSDEPANSILRYGTNAAVADLTLAVTNPVVTTDHSFSLGGLAAGATYYFYVVSTDEAGNTATNSNGGSLFSFVVAPVATVLLVDEYLDPYGLGAPPLSDYTDPLSQLGVSYDLWDATAAGEPSLEVMRPYRAVIWRTPDFVSVWSPDTQLAISNYLNSGGSLLVSSMEILSRLDEEGAAAFTRNVLQVQSYLTDETGSTGAAEIIGSPNEPIGSGLDIVMDYTEYEALWYGYVGPDISDTITPSANASAILRNDAGDVVGLRWPAIGQQAPGRLVFLSFPLEAVPLESGVNDRLNLLRNILSFLAPGASGRGTVALNSSAYSLPSTATVEVGDSDLAGKGTLVLPAYTTTDTNGISLTLQETPTRGVFTGSFGLVPTTNSPASGVLRAQDGDVVTVEYHDDSEGATVQATAAVDQTPPSIGAVAAEADYEQATIYWDTSEPADGLVQYGESPLVTRTAYDSAYTTSHAITLPALTPNRTYYYRVVSRDAAGNAAAKDNYGQLYTFKTLTPLSPPWTDGMDSGATNWTLFNADENQTEWTLGVPNNGLESSAHSPPNAWGSNLNGNSVDYAETFLISPAIDLTGGNVATLRFWHSYDFSETSEFDILEYGDLLLLTNNATAPVTLAEYSEVSGGWQQEQIDLTPYVGHVIYLVWDYELFSFDTRVRPGWLVDDVSISVSNVAPGTIQITNNLWQAPYILTGPLYFKGKGLGTLITNAPPGRYVITFGDVPYYQTPAPQTKDLASDATATFEGEYTFVDVNSNGIPDGWEQDQFGSVDSNRTQMTDTDGDGMTDWEEFVAGTDPNNPLPPIRLTAYALTNGWVRLEWPSVRGYAYRLDSSPDAAGWAPWSDWIQATGPKTNYDVSPAAEGQIRLFRLEAVANTNAAVPPPDLRVTAKLTANNAVRLEWMAGAGRAYRLWGSADASNWMPASGWTQSATTRLIGFTLPSPTNAAPYLFRVQVQP